METISDESSVCQYGLFYNSAARILMICVPTTGLAYATAQMSKVLDSKIEGLKLGNGDLVLVRQADVVFGGVTKQPDNQWMLPALLMPLALVNL